MGKTRRQRRRLLKTFDKGSRLRKALKKALKDRKISKKEIRNLTRKGASLKQLQRIRSRSNKFSRFKSGSGVDQRKEVRKVFKKVTRKRRANSLYDIAKNGFLNTTPGSNKIPEYVAAPKKPTTPTGPPPNPPTRPTAPTPTPAPKTPTAAEVNEQLKITPIDTKSTPEQNLETLSTNSNVKRYARELSGSLAEQAAAADMTIEQYKEKMNDPAYRMRVKGIRFADRGTGGMTRSQLARRGTTGVFGRSGLRIQSLNI